MMTEARNHESATDFQCEVGCRFPMETRAQNSDVSYWTTPTSYSGCALPVSLHRSLRFSVAVAQGQSGKPGSECSPFEAISVD
jgi:hypothetical protein